MADASIDGTRIHYEIDGEGEPLFVLHGGLGIDHVVYRRTLQPLGDRRRLIFLDHRGNGRSEIVDPLSITMPQLADDVAGLADHLGIDRFSVLGHSYGGFIAQELAIRHGERLDRMILVATTPGQLGEGEAPPVDEVPHPPEEMLALMGSPLADDAEMEQMLWKLLPYYFHRADLAVLTPLFEGTIYRLAAMIRGFEVLAGWSSVDRLATVPVPTLVLAGRHDLFTSWPQSYRIGNRLPDADVVVFEESGHFPWIEQPGEFFAAVL